MENSKQPIYPTLMQKIGDNEYRASRPGDDKLWNVPMAGLTKREWFAGMALQGILANGFKELDGKGIFDAFATDALRAADALLAQLDN